ncbi:MAG: NAD-binding protein [Pseudomonadota bacterium]|nr:NAD-binding protein [Pseudomonadota bacterium]
MSTPSIRFLVWHRLRELGPLFLAKFAVPPVLIGIATWAGMQLGLHPWEALYAVLQGFSLGLDLAPDPTMVATHPVWNGVAWTVRYILPIATGAALLEGLRYMRWIRNPLILMRGHVVVVGGGNLGAAVARHFHHNRRERVVVIENDDRNTNIAALEAEGIRVLVGDGRHRHVLDRANTPFAETLVVVAKDDVVNVEVAQRALQLAGPSRLRCLVHVSDRRFRESLAKLYAGEPLETFDTYEYAAERLVCEDLRDRLSHHHGLIVVAGFGRFGRAVLDAIWRLGSQQRRVLVIDRDPASVEAARVLARRHGAPEPEHCTSDLLDDVVPLRLAREPDPAVVLLCTDNDVRNLDLAVRLGQAAGADDRIDVIMRVFSKPRALFDEQDRLAQLPAVKARTLSQLAVQQIEALLRAPPTAPVRAVVPEAAAAS